MKGYTKFLMGGAMLVGICAGGIINTKTTYATGVIKDRNTDIDIMPPICTFQVEGASFKDGKYYTAQKNVTLTIEAEDNVSAPENMKMIISSEEITGDDIKNESKWEAFSSTKPWVLSALNGGKNTVYLVVKDEAGNISNGVTISTTPEYTVTYSGEGTGIPAPKTTKPGVVFNVAVQEPKLEGKYFLGWSSSSAADRTVQWLSDGIIEPRYINGDTTLYAVYSDNPPALSTRVEIGDYVNYPVDYRNVASYNNSYKSVYTGWRVLYVDGEQVTLISAGTPILYNHTSSIGSATSVTNLTTNFLADDEKFKEVGFPYLTLATSFNNPFTEKVESVTKADIEKALGATSSLSYNYNLRNYGSLFDNGTYYWLATANNSNSLWFVGGNNGALIYIYGSTNGVRPKVSLKSGIQTAGRNESGAWELIMP